MRKYIVEFIGVFFLTLLIVMVSHNGTPAGFMPLAIGLGLVALTYAGGHISGAHYNPAVTFAFFIQKKININDTLGYILAQIIGAVFGAYTAIALLNEVAESTDPKPFQFTSPIPPLLGEFIGTFALVYVFLNMTLSKANAGKSYTGLAIGLTFAAVTFALAPVTGGGFNPAVSIGLSSVKVLDWVNQWVYSVGALGGGAIASVIFTFLMMEENNERPVRKQSTNEQRTTNSEQSTTDNEN